MEKHFLALIIATLTCSGYVSATESEDIDMSSPTEAYTALGVGYGNEGLSLRAMFMTS